MAWHNTLGQIGEEEACRYLTLHHYTLLARNWRVGHLELDIVAEHFGEIIFVEVKTRRSEAVETAFDAVDEEKRYHLVQAARAYMIDHCLKAPYRFDIVTVVGEQRPFDIKHYRRVFEGREVMQHISQKKKIL